MKFEYQQFVSPMPGSSDFQLILRPIIEVRFFGAEKSILYDALIDTGADETLLPMRLAEELGVSLTPELMGQSASFIGEPIETRFGEIEMEISDGLHFARWKTVVSFADFGAAKDPIAILGHGGFLDYLHRYF